MFERLSAPILACCNSLLSAVFCAWLPFRAHCLANCLRAKDVKLSSFCKPEGHRFKVQMDMEFMAKQSYQQKRGSKIPLALPLCFFFPRLPPPCAVRGPGEVLYFARFPWAAFHWDRYLQDFVGSLRHCTVLPNSWYIQTLNSSRATTQSTLRLQSLWFFGSAGCFFLFCLSNAMIQCSWSQSQLRRVNGWGHVGFHDCHCLAWMWFLPSI